MQPPSVCRIWIEIGYFFSLVDIYVVADAEGKQMVLKIHRFVIFS